MSNCHQIVTAEDSIECAKEMFEKMEEALREEDIECHGFSVEHDGQYAYIYAEDWGNPDALPEDFLEAFAYVLILAGIPFMEFGAAYYDDKAKPDSSGGFKFRIWNDTIVEYSVTHFPSDVARLREIGACPECHAEIPAFDVFPGHRCGVCGYALWEETVV